MAVKVQHPALEEWVPLDPALTTFMFSTLKRFFPECDLAWLSNEMESALTNTKHQKRPRSLLRQAHLARHRQ